MYGILYDNYNDNESIEGHINNTLINLLFSNDCDSSIISDEQGRNNCLVDENTKKDNSIPAQLDKIKIEFKQSEESSTNIKTLILPKFYSLDEIMNLFDKIYNNNQIKNKLNEGKSIEQSIGYTFMSTLNKKRKREDEKIDLLNEEKIKNGQKRGRKTSNCSKTEHDKTAADNIIKKIKTKLFEFILKFINLLLKKMKFNIELLKLNYIYVDQLSRNNELQLLNSLLKDLLSLDISPKYKNKNKEYNKKVIEEIIGSEKILKEKNDFYYETLMFVLNITFRNWFDVFTGKNNFENLAKDYIGNQAKINFKLIEESFVGVNTLLDYLADENKNDNNYFAFFVFYLYNYERWFLIKSPRQKKVK